MQKIKNLINKWYTMPDTAKASIAFVISSFVLKGIVFISTPVFTRIINTAEYGIIAEYNSWMSIMEVAALLGLTSAGIINVGLNDYRDCRDKYLSVLMTICNTMTIVVFGIVFMIQYLLDRQLFLPTNLWILMLIYFIFNPAQIFWLSRQRYEYKYKLAVIITVCSSVLSQIVSLICVLNAKTDNLAEIKLWSSNITMLVFSVPIYFYILFKGKKLFDKEIWKTTVMFALSLLPHYMAQHIMSGSDRIMIANLAGKADAGIYSIVLNVYVIATVMWSAVNASLIPFIYECLNKNKYDRINRTVIPVIMVYGLFCILIVIIAPEIIRFLAPPEYYSGIYSVPPIMATAFFTALYNIYATIEFYHKKSLYISIATITAAAVNIALNALLIPRFGFTAAAYTTLISNIILVFVHYIGYRKSHPEKVYNDKALFLISTGCVISCEAVNLLYINNAVRYIIVLSICILAIVFRKKLLSIFSTLKSKEIDNNGGSK